MAFNKVARAPDEVALRNVLVSTYDKSGLAATIREIAGLCPEARFYSTGGTLTALKEALGPGGADRVVAVSDYTGQPEMQGGLVKTLDWKIYLGLLAESGNASHEADLARAGAVRFDAVVANLYPFAEAAGDSGSAVEDLRQRIDIGGPAMIRAAAKNFLRVASVSDPGQYPALLAELRARGGRCSLAFRKRLAAEVFARVSSFDALVAGTLAGIGEAALAAAYGKE